MNDTPAQADRHWVDLIATGDVPPGHARTVLVAGRAYAVCNDAGRLAVVDNACPHAGGNLGEAAVRDGRIVCPWHHYEFNLATGRSPGFPGRLRVYPCRVRDGRVEARLELR